MTFSRPHVAHRTLMVRKSGPAARTVSLSDWQYWHVGVLIHPIPFRSMTVATAECYAIPATATTAVQRCRQ